MASRRVSIEITADATGATRTFDQIGEAAQAAAKEATEAGEKVSEAAAAARVEAARVAADAAEELKVKEVKDAEEAAVAQKAASDEAAASALRSRAAFEGAAGGASNLFLKMGSLMSGIPILGEMFTHMGEKVEGADTKVGSFGQALAGAGKLALLAGATGFAVVGYESIKMASDFQASMERLHTNAGVAQSAIKPLSESVEHLAGAVGFSPDELSTGLYHLASNGLRGKDAMNALKIAAEGAKNGNADLEDVTNALGAVIASKMVPGVKNYSQAMGDLNATVGAGDMKMQDLADALGTGVLASVKGFGVSLRDTGAALATFGDNNIRGAKAGTELRMAVQAMADPVKAGAGALKSMGLTTKSLADEMEKGGLKGAIDMLAAHMKHAGDTGTHVGSVLTDAFGKKAGVGIDVLVSQLGRFNGKFAEIGTSSHKFGSDWTATQETTKQQMADLRASVEALGTKFGAFLIPKLEGVAKVAEKVVLWFQKNKEASEILASIVGGALVVAIGAATISMIGFVISTAEIWAPIVALIAAIGGIIYVATHFTQVWDFVKAHLIEIIPALVLVLGPIGALAAAAILVADHWKTCSAVLKEVWAKILAVTHEAVAAIVGFIKPEIASLVSWWHDHWAEIHEVIDAVWKAIREVIRVAWDAIKPIVHAGVDELKDTVTVGLGVIETSWSVAWDLVKSTVKVAWDVIKGTVQVAVSAVETVIGVALDLITGHWSRAWNELKTGVSNILTETVSTIKGVVGTMGQAATSVGKAILNGVINALGSLWSQVSGKFSDLFSDVKGLASAAGAAASSIGSAIVSGIVSGIKSAGGEILSEIESLIPGGAVGSFVKNHLHLAEGGIVTSPQLAWIAEAGYPEAVVPLKDGLSKAAIAGSVRAFFGSSFSDLGLSPSGGGPAGMGSSQSGLGLGSPAGVTLQTKLPSTPAEAAAHAAAIKAEQGQQAKGLAMLALSVKSEMAKAAAAVRAISHVRAADEARIAAVDTRARQEKKDDIERAHHDVAEGKKEIEAEKARTAREDRDSRPKQYAGESAATWAAAEAKSASERKARDAKASAEDIKTRARMVADVERERKDKEETGLAAQREDNRIRAEQKATVARLESQRQDADRTLRQLRAAIEALAKVNVARDSSNTNINVVAQTAADSNQIAKDIAWAIKTGG